MNSRPRISEQEAREILKANKVADQVAIIGIRGYYLDSLGAAGANDRNVYDDAIIVVSARRFETFRANTDPSVYRKGIATMATGVHRYYKGKHKNRYWALRLVGERAAVTRDGERGEKVGIALNIHKGGSRSTGSRGCQTLAPADWDDFIEIVYDEMDFYGQKTIPYVLIDEKDRRRGLSKMPLLAEKEIENLLIRFDESDEKEPAAQIGKPSEKPAFEPAVVSPAAASSASQSPTKSASPAQPVQSIIEKSIESFTLPSLGGYLTEATETVTQAKDTVSQTVERQETIIEKAGKIGDTMQSVSERVVQIQNSFAPISKSSWAITLFSKVLGFALFVFALAKDNWKELLIAVLLIGIGAYIYSHAKDRAVAKQTAAR